MKLWVDAQLSPAIAGWLAAEFHVEAVPVRDLGLRDADDREIFFKARDAKAVVMTKDSDFVDMVRLYGAPPQILWITCGNTSNARLRDLLRSLWLTVTHLLEKGEALVEITSVRVGNGINQ